MPTRRRLFFAAAAGAVSLVLPACASRARVRIGYQNNGLLLIAKQRGDLDAVARVDWQSFASGPPLLEAMSVGGVDLGGTGDTPPVVAQSQGANLVLVAAQPVAGAAAAILVPAGSSLAGAASLRGRRVAFLRGSSAQIFVAAALRDAGLTLGDIEAINLAPGDAAAAFARGSLDAWAVWDPWLANAEVELKARVLVGGRPLAASNSFLLANRDFATAQPDALRAVLDALKGTAAWAAANRPALTAMIGAAAGLAPTVAARVASRQDLALVKLTPAIVAREQALADALLAQGVIPARVDIARTVWNGWRG